MANGTTRFIQATNIVVKFIYLPHLTMSAGQRTKGTLKPLAVMVGGPASDYALLQEICEKSGWGLCRARNRRDTARILQTGRVEVVISHRDLPQGNWRDLLRDLSNVHWHARLS